MRVSLTSQHIHLARQNLVAAKTHQILLLRKALLQVLKTADGIRALALREQMDGCAQTQANLLASAQRPHSISSCTILKESWNELRTDLWTKAYACNA